MRCVCGQEAVSLLWDGVQEKKSVAVGNKVRAGGATAATIGVAAINLEGAGEGGMRRVWWVGFFPFWQ